MQTVPDKLRELRALHEDGLLSLQEFDSRRNALLDAEYAPARSRASDMAPPRQGTEIGLMAGMEIGPENRRYRLARLIANGGMGQVWQALDVATQAELGKDAMVALKILPAHLTQGDVRARLLVEEATEARKLAHEHIVRVYEWARDPATESYFLIMECLEGEDLDSLLAREGPLPLARALDIAAPIAQALDYAWERQRLVHRDIKPGNVFVTTAGDIKLLDFGIAARARLESAAAGQVLPGAGSASYRAPESGTARRQPARTLDVYAVAVMLYLMVEGRLPFGGRRSAFDQPPAPAALTRAQWAVLQKGFAVEPARRPASVAQLLAALAAAGTPRAAPVAAAALPQQPDQHPAEDPCAAVPAHVDLAPLPAPAVPAPPRMGGRAERDAARRARREVLRQQLRERRAQDAAAPQAALQADLRRLRQAMAAAAYRAEQQRAGAGLAARTAAELGMQARPVDSAPPPSAPSPDAKLLSDRFLDGSGEGPQLVEIAAGRFLMGSPDHERKKAIEAGASAEWLARETPQRWVGIEQPFALGRFPVTVGEWRQFALATGWRGHGDVNWTAPGFPQADDHPVVGVTWGDAQEYLRWLGKLTGQRYRLPSEAEWEYACRAGTKSAFSCGDRIDTSLANFDGNYSYNGSPKGVFRQGTTPVDAFAPNRWGLHDMHGNVWEWVQDVAHDNYAGAPPDGRPWEEGGDPNRRVLRGGCWLYNPRYLRSALRNAYSAVLGSNIVGFRVARDLG